LITSSDPRTSASTPRIAPAPISVPMRNTRLTQLTRFASASLGTSMPVALATAAPSPGSRLLSCSRASTVTGSSAERCRCTRAPRAVSASSTRPAAAAVRSAPARTAIAVSTAARSPSRRPSGADEAAQRKSFRQTLPSAETMTVSDPSALCAMSASRSRSTERMPWRLSRGLSGPLGWPVVPGCPGQVPDGANSALRSGAVQGVLEFLLAFLG
jgi:hypothetical protein